MRLFPFLSSSSSSFFLIAVVFVVVVLQRARICFFGEKRARGVKIFVPPPRAGGFPFFSLSSLSLSLRRHFGRARSVIFFFVVVVVFVARFGATLTLPAVDSSSF